jgi:hypothetical protein
MKKMIFSAVALIAFSFAGMANEIEEKKIEVELKIKKENKEVVKANCVEVANALMILHPEAWGDAFTYVGTWVIIYSNCQASN